MATFDFIDALIIFVLIATPITLFLLVSGSAGFIGSALVIAGIITLFFCIGPD